MLLVDIWTKRAADFHGHLCPDLVIGCKACELARRILGEGRLLVVAENAGAALDALQVLAGCTWGNGRLLVEDRGKHNYLFVREGETAGVRLCFQGVEFPDEDRFRLLEDRFLARAATLEEVAIYQGMVERRTRELLQRRPEELFELEMVEVTVRRAEEGTAWERCQACGQPVVRHRLRDCGGARLCEECREMLSRCGGVA